MGFWGHTPRTLGIFTTDTRKAGRYLVERSWHKLNDEDHIFYKAKCDHCSLVKKPRELNLVLEKSPEGKVGRYVGKLHVFCDTCIDKMNRPFSWKKKCKDLKYSDIKELMSSTKLVLISHGKDLFIDFAIVVSNYRTDVRLQSY